MPTKFFKALSTGDAKKRVEVFRALPVASVLRKLVRRWNDFSIVKRLYGVVGIMALLVALELITLMFAIQTLSAVRAFVGGEGLWSKAQKNAISNLQNYALTSDRSYYKKFLDDLNVPLGDRKARLALESIPPNPELAREGFIQGRIHPDDIPNLVKFITRFSWNHFVTKALREWREGDRLMDQLITEGKRLDKLVLSGHSVSREVQRAFFRLNDLNEKITAREDAFSFTLGEGSRWAESTVFMVLFGAVASVEFTGLLLTFFFSRHLSRGLREMGQSARAIGAGEFDQKAPVRSRDELGTLAKALNQMADELKTNIGERQNAENASQWKSLFVANMSHEIRTPLSAIMGFTELLKDPSISDSDRTRYLDIVSRTGETLNKIINDVLDLSKVEAGRLDFEVTETDLRPFIGELQEILSIKSEEKGVHLSFEPADDAGPLPEKVIIDPVRVRQIVMNLVSNAIKFTQAGGDVRVRYRVDAEVLTIRVIDTGAGISSAEQPLLFQPYTQTSSGHASVLKQASGTGLGLFLSRRLAQAMGGDVQLVSSNPAVGSVFEARIKLLSLEHCSRANVTDVLPPVDLSGDVSGRLKEALVLVVDDAMENRLLIERILTKRGARVISASNGREAVSVALAEPVDLVLMDMQMPILNGFQATRELRARGFATPILALTAQAMREDKLRCLAVGCSAYLTKPVNSQELIQTVGRHLPPSGPHSSARLTPLPSSNIVTPLEL